MRAELLPKQLTSASELQAKSVGQGLLGNSHLAGAERA
jgi:hypothetical protein